MRALITGATGFIGPRLLERLNQPVVLSRNVYKVRERLQQDGLEAYSWDPLSGPAPTKAFEGVDVVFHLAGESVASGRWTKRRKQQIRESRELGTRNLVETFKQLRRRPKVLVSASAVGYYGSRGDDLIDEASPPGHDFLADVCVAWEREAMRAAELDVRVVCLRTGIVLGPNGGALKKLITPFKLGVGGPLGNGRQWMPWIHLDDLVSMYLFAANQPNVTGPLNGSAPNPVTNREFTKTLAAVVHRPAIFPVPYFALRVALGEFAKVLFDSQRAVPQAALAGSFTFQYPELRPALESIVSAKPAETPVG